MKEGVIELDGWKVRARVDRFGLLHLDADAGKGKEAVSFNPRKHASVGQHYRALISSDEKLNAMETATCDAQGVVDIKTRTEYYSHPAVKANVI